MSTFKRWLPALALMVVIFLFSNTPKQDLPNYGLFDMLVKKGGHVTGYALLGLAYWYALGFDLKKIGWAWVLAVLYALSDEFHQSFVAGRGATIWDVILYDATGAALALWLGWMFRHRAAKKE